MWVCARALANSYARMCSWKRSVSFLFSASPCFHLFLSFSLFLFLPFFLSFLRPPVSIHSPSRDLPFLPRAFANSPGDRESAWTAGEYNYGKNKSSVFSMPRDESTFQGTSSAIRRERNKNTRTGRAPTKEITARSGITIIKLLSIDKLLVTAVRVEAFF